MRVPKDSVAIIRIILVCLKLANAKGTDLNTGESPRSFPFDADLLIRDRDAFSRAFAELNTMRRAQSLLVKLLGMLGSEIARLQSLVRPASFHHGINSIPDDILETILRMEVEGSLPFCSSQGGGIAATIGRFALVSQRFYRIVDSSHSIWSYVSTYDSMPSIRKFLEKSVNAPVKLILNPSDAGVKTTATMALLGARMGEISSLDAGLGWRFSKKSNDDRSIWDLTGTETFLSMTELSIGYNVSIPGRLHFPNLKRLNIKGFSFPKSTHIFLAKLVHLDINTNSVFEYSQPYLDLIPLLRTTSMLTTLKLHNVFLVKDVEEMPAPVTLPRLQTLSIRASESKAGRNAAARTTGRLAEIARFTRLLIPGQLNSFCVQVYSPDLRRLIFATDDTRFFSGSVILEHVQELSLIMRGDLCGGLNQQQGRLADVQADARAFIPTFLNQFPAVKTFRLHVSKITETVDFQAPILRVQNLYLSGSQMSPANPEQKWEGTMSVIPKIVDAITTTELLGNPVNLREVIISLNGCPYPEGSWLERAFRHPYPAFPSLILDQAIGRQTLLTVLQRTSAGGPNQRM